MPLVKQCIQPGCTGLAMFGFGVPSKSMRWACKQHRELIWIGAAPAPGEGGTGNFSGPVPPSPPRAQGSLF
jgi:hypothetical protein